MVPSAQKVVALKGQIAVSIFLVLVTVLPSLAGNPDVRQRLFWPNLALSKDVGERIEAVEVFVSCGRFRGVSNIPNDWSLKVVSPSSEQTHLRFSAGHGATMLWGLRQLDGVITVAVTEPSCFDIYAQVTTEISGESRIHKFSHAELRLSP